jgi:nucleoside-diphosphate-sugar epimerase
MNILITGVCGFVGSSVAKSLLAHDPSLTIYGVDNLIRPGSETNRALLGLMARHPGRMQYLPKGATMARVTQSECDLIAGHLNNRPRKRHGYKTPNQCFLQT